MSPPFPYALRETDPLRLPLEPHGTPGTVVLWGEWLGRAALVTDNGVGFGFG